MSQREVRRPKTHHVVYVRTRLAHPEPARNYGLKVTASSHKCLISLPNIFIDRRLATGRGPHSPAAKVWLATPVPQGFFSANNRQAIEDWV